MVPHLSPQALPLGLASLFCFFASLFVVQILLVPKLVRVKSERSKYFALLEKRLLDARSAREEVDRRLTHESNNLLYGPLHREWEATYAASVRLQEERLHAKRVAREMEWQVLRADLLLLKLADKIFARWSS